MLEQEVAKEGANDLDEDVEGLDASAIKNEEAGKTLKNTTIKAKAAQQNQDDKNKTKAQLKREERKV
jgi:hypothetical protein